LVVGATRIAKGVESLQETDRDRAPGNREGQQMKVAIKVHIETKDRPVNIIHLWRHEYNRRPGGARRERTV